MPTVWTSIFGNQYTDILLTMGNVWMSWFPDYQDPDKQDSSME